MEVFVFPEVVQKIELMLVTDDDCAASRSGYIVYPLLTSYDYVDLAIIEYPPTCMSSIRFLGRYRSHPLSGAT
jgi:hypothetical protein